MSRLQTPTSRQDDRYYAQPYSLDAVGFSFTSLADYQTQARNHEDRFGQPVEEYELQYLDGDHHQLFGALGISQATLAAWFALLEALDGDDDRYLIACRLAEYGCPIDELANRWADYHLYHGTAADYAAEVVAECYQLPDKLEAYLDYEKLGRDMVFEGSITELEHTALVVARQYRTSMYISRIVLSHNYEYLFLISTNVPYQIIVGYISYKKILN